jgi:hypothetical protein
MNTAIYTDMHMRTVIRLNASPVTITSMLTLLPFVCTCWWSGAAAFDDTILRRMFVVPSFEIHGGVGGLFDLGPPACGLKVRLHTSKYYAC